MVVISHFQALPIFYLRPLLVWEGISILTLFCFSTALFRKGQPCSVRYSAPRVWDRFPQCWLNNVVWRVLHPESATAGKCCQRAFPGIARRISPRVKLMERFFFIAFVPWPRFLFSPFSKNSFLFFLWTLLQGIIRSYKEPMPLLLELEHRLIDLSEL